MPKLKGEGEERDKEGEREKGLRSRKKGSVKNNRNRGKRERKKVKDFFGKKEKGHGGDAEQEQHIKIRGGIKRDEISDGGAGGEFGARKSESGERCQVFR